MNILKKYCVRFFYFLFFLVVTVFIILASVIFYSKFIIETGDTHDVAPTEIKFIDIGNNEEIAYQEIDNKSKDTIIFVGGLSGWSETWMRTMLQLDDSLKKNKTPYNLIAVDLPPFGYSKIDVSKGFYRDVQAVRLNAFREAKKISSATFVGHSYGAGPVTEAVMQNPEGVKKLIVMDGVLNIGDIRTESKESILTSDFVLSNFVSLVSHNVPLIKYQLKNFVYKKENIDNLMTQMYIQPFSQKGNGPKVGAWLRDYGKDPLGYKSTIESEYEKLNIPLRIIWGVEDIITPLSLGEHLLEITPGASIQKLQGVGHIPMVEDYEKVDTAILDSIIN